MLCLDYDVLRIWKLGINIINNARMCQFISIFIISTIYRYQSNPLHEARELTLSKIIHKIAYYKDTTDNNLKYYWEPFMSTGPWAAAQRVHI